MSEPLYSVGQHVAVCSIDMTVIIPQTVVVGFYWHDGGDTICGRTGRTVFEKPTWVYRVEGAPTLPFHKAPLPFREASLRPINPDEYLDTTHQSTESQEGVVL